MTTNSESTNIESTNPESTTIPDTNKQYLFGTIVDLTKYPTVDISRSTLSPERIQHYFDTLDQYMVHCVNGLLLNVDFNKRNVYLCDICGGSCNKQYFYCMHCYRDICVDCYETDIECKKIPDKIIPRSSNISVTFCDKCHNPVFDSTCYTDNDNYDMCIQCAKIYEKTVSRRRLELVDVDRIFPCDHCNFGSLLDWVPLVLDKCTDEDDSDEIADYAILLNTNSASPYHNQVAFMAGNAHNRRVYYSCPGESASDIMAKYGQTKSIIQMINQRSINIYFY